MGCFPQQRRSVLEHGLKDGTMRIRLEYKTVLDGGGECPGECTGLAWAFVYFAKSGVWERPFRANCTATAANRSPISRVTSLRANGLKRRVPRAASQKIQ